MSPLNVKAIVLPSGEIAGYRIQLAPCGEVDGDCAAAMEAGVTDAAIAAATAAAARSGAFICIGGVGGSARGQLKSVKRGDGVRHGRPSLRRDQPHCIADALLISWTAARH